MGRYITKYEKETKRNTHEHVLVWQQHHQRRVPPGYHIHHIDNNPRNNHPDNLLLVTPDEHAKIHAGCQLRDGIWYKPCPSCNEYKPHNEEHFYYHDGAIKYAKCRPCYLTELTRIRAEQKHEHAVISGQITIFDLLNEQRSPDQTHPH